MIGKSLFRRRSGKFPKSPIRVKRPTLCLESLEDRCVPAVFLVNTLADTQAVNLTTGEDAHGNISLRSALEAANSVGGGSQIDLTVGGDYRIAAGGQANTGSNSNGGARLSFCPAAAASPSTTPAAPSRMSTALASTASSTSTLRTLTMPPPKLP